MRWSRAALLASCASVPMGALHGQSTAGNDDVREPVVSAQGRLPVAGCAGQPISSIVVITQPPYTERLPRQLEFVRRMARNVHTNTNEDVVRRYLLLKPGDPCNQIRRAESERILRAQPFLVEARIRVYDDEAGGVLLEVETRDEFSLIFSPRLTAASPVLSGLRIGESNLGGTARMVAAQWKDGRAYNDVWAFALTDYQFARDRNELRLLAARYERGQLLRAEIVRPYYTDLQRYAYIGSITGDRNFFRLRRVDGPSNAVNVSRQTAVLGAIARNGPVGRLRLFGMSLTHSREKVDSIARIIAFEGFQPNIGAAPGVRFRERNVARANALVGLRFLRFVPVQGFDALTGTQDVPVGFQLHTVLGKSLPIGAVTEHDRFFAANLYVGVGGPRSFIGAQVITEARNDRGSRSWDNHVASGRLAWYLRPATRQLTVVSAEWSAGRDMRTPFQLSLADIAGGIHGHRNSQSPGAHRAVVRAEQRMVIPSRLNVADAGLAVFAEGGRLWKDASVPYSVTTPVRGAVGVSILAAVPPRSRRLWRVDFALPLGGDPYKKFEVRISNEDRTRVFWREPRDVQAGRERTVPATLFAWP